MNENLALKDNVIEDGDRSLSSTFASDVYAFTIDQAYTDTSASGADYLDISLFTEQGRTLKSRLYYTSGTAKGHSITYPVRDKATGKATGEEKYLPSFTLCNDIYQLINGYGLAGMKTEEKVVKCWDSAAKKELPQKKQVCMDLKGKKIALAVLEQIVMKQVNKDGNWVDSKETRKNNEVVKAFNAETAQTATEIKNDAEAAWIDGWLAKYKGEVMDTTSSGTKTASGAKATGEKKKLDFS